MSVRKFARVTNRVETGAIQFGEDWPGLFLRGDDANYLSLAIEHIMKHVEGAKEIESKLVAMHLMEIKKLIDTEVVQKSEQKPA